jgi:hypothetical protein
MTVNITSNAGSWECPDPKEGHWYLERGDYIAVVTDWVAQEGYYSVAVFHKDENVTPEEEDQIDYNTVEEAKKAAEKLLKKYVKD